MSQVDELVANLRSGLVRLHAVLDGMDDAGLATTPDSGWSVAGTLVHLAFYDDWVAERWRRRLSAGRFQDLPDDITELVNAAGQRGWSTAEPHLARTAALRAADSVADLIEHLPPDALEDAIRTGRERMIDRSAHWIPHLGEIGALRDRVPDGGDA